MTMNEVQNEIALIVKFHIGAAGDQRAFQRELSDLVFKFAEDAMKRQVEACAMRAAIVTPEWREHVRKTPLVEFDS